jgi:hypothetical protein
MLTRGYFFNGVSLFYEFFLCAVLAIFLSLLNACNTNERVSEVHIVTQHSDTIMPRIITPSQLEITYFNKSDLTILFWHRSLNHADYLNAFSMIYSVVDSTMTETERAFALWRFVSESGFHYPYSYNHSLTDNIDPISLVTFPCFLCGEKAGILANLAHLAGLNSRVITMRGHIVTEILCDGSWSMFDADENVTFLSAIGKPYSVAELSFNPDLICKENILMGVDERFIGYRNYRRYMIGYKPDSTWINESFIIENYQAKSMMFKLNPSDSIQFLLSKPSLYKHLFFKRYNYEAEGYLHRNILLDRLQQKSKNKMVYAFEDTLPFFIKTLSVDYNKSEIVDAWIDVTNRISGKSETVAKGKLGGNNTMQVSFNAPSDSCIHYDYKLTIVSADRLKGNVNVKIGFVFNPLVFPYTKSGPIVIEKQGTGELRVRINGR